MQVVTFDKEPKLEKKLFLDNDILIFTKKSLSFNLLTERKQGKILLKKIIDANPELRPYLDENSLAIFGLNLSNKILKQQNPNYTFELVAEEKLSGIEYSKLISQNKLPLSYRFIESWNHDFYLHGMGAKDIPSSFSSWYKEKYNFLSEEEKVIMSSVVEFSTLKHFQEESLMSICKPSNWYQLAGFISGFRSNEKLVSEIFKKYKAEEFFAETLGEKYAQG